MNGFERLDLADHIAKAMEYLSVRIGRRETVLEVCDCLDDETLERVFEHLLDTAEDGIA